MKKILLLLFVALVLVVHGNAGRISFMEHQLLSGVNPAGQTAATVHNKDSTTVIAAPSKEPETAETKTGSEEAGEENSNDDGEANENYNNYGQDSGTDSHRYFPCVERRSAHCS